jgi:uncharacterized OsmC-like protein
MTMEITYTGGMQFQVEAEGHTLLVDQPVDGGGADSGPSPTALLAASVGTCVGTFILFYCRKHSLDATEMRISVEYSYANAPRRMDRIATRVTLPPQIGDEHLPGLEKFAHACTVHNTLLQTAELPLELVRA